MPTLTSDAYLYLTATSDGSSLTPTSTWTHVSTGQGVFDDGDGNADTSADYFIVPQVPYSGYTIEINGQDYALFHQTGSNIYYVPYFDTTDGFASLAGTAVTQPITQSGENAIVVNLCFAAGTHIFTPLGETAVETLQIGDLVTTADGRDVPVKWLGVQTHTARAVNLRLPERAQPVRIAAGALGGGLPHTDLTVTADHGMIVDGLVINAAALINGTTIDFVPLAELGNSFTVYHIETEAHDVILANGAASETFIDAAGRAAFDNHQEYLDLYGVERIIPEMDRPRISSARLVPQAIKDRLGNQKRDDLAEAI